MGITDAGNLVAVLKLFHELAREIAVVGTAAAEHTRDTGERTNVVGAPEGVRTTGDKEHLAGGRTGAGVAVTR